MKILSSISTFALLVCFSVKVSAQTDITGKWGVSTIDVPGNMFVDVSKDSIFLSPAMIDEMTKEGAGDSASRQMVIGILKNAMVKAFTEMTMVVENDGSITQYANGVKGDKIGQLNSAKNTVTYTDEKTGRQKTLPVETKDGLLKLLLPADDNEGDLTLWCKKII